MKRRDFIKTVAAGAAATGVTKTGWAVPSDQEYELERPESPDNILSACPYCGVGCGTILKTRNGRIVNIVPDKDHPTNKGLQCIKGLTSAEAIYVNRLTAPLIRKDMSDPLTGKVSKTKGSYDPKHFRVATWDEAEELIADQVAGIIKKTGGNSVGLYGSGQLSLEGQYLENIFMKGIIGSNTIEANARMCMTSAVTGYIKSLGSDTPPTCYDDIELADMICFWGHNARGAHPILYWRVADTKAQRNIPTLVVDPRRTGTVQGLEDVNPENSHHFPTINGDISIHNAIAWAILNRHPEAVAKEFLEGHTSGWKEYIDQVQTGYRPEDVVDRTKIAPEKIYEIAKIWAEASIKGKKRGSGGVLCIWGIGYNQHLHGQHNTIGLVNLLALYSAAS
jgi:anaerobic selenocysteine-containing dehydrogenase